MGRKNKSKRKDSTTSESHDETTPLGTTDTTPAAPAPSPSTECADGRSGPCAERSTETPTAPVAASAEANTPSTAPETNTAPTSSETNTPVPSTTPEANPASSSTSPIVAAATTGVSAPATEEVRPADGSDAAPGLLRRIIRWIPIIGRYV